LAHSTALGHAQRDQPEHGRFRVAHSVRRVRELAAKGLTNTGTENYGGPIVTAGGLVFIGATNFDRKFRAPTGPRGARHDPRSASGGAYVAFALPR